MKTLVLAFIGWLALSPQQNIQGKWMICFDNPGCEAKVGPGFAYFQFGETSMQHYMLMDAEQEPVPMGAPMSYTLGMGSMTIQDQDASIEVGLFYLEQDVMALVYRQKMDTMYLKKIKEPSE